MNSDEIERQQLKKLLGEWSTNPSLFLEQAFESPIYPEEWQLKIWTDVIENDRVAIRSGHGVGKTALLAWIIIWWHLTRFPAKTACTAPSAHQLNDNLWGEIAIWHRKLKARMRDLLTVTAEKVEFAEAPKESVAVARTARKENPDAFQGFHSENMLFIGDEASGIDDVIFEVGEGAMSTRGAKTLLTGNPTRTSGFFFEAFHKDRARWKTRKVACEDSSLVDPAYAESIAKKYGGDSNVFRVRVLGEFPKSEDDVVIPLDWIESAVTRDVVSTRARTIWGLDVARFGDDRTALAKRRGNTLLAPVKSWHGKDTMQVAGLIMQEWKETEPGDRPDQIAVDVIGIGAGVVDALNAMNLPVMGVNVAESPAARDRFARQRDELWWTVREWFEGRDVKIPDDEDLIAELTSPKYKPLPTGKLQVEPKDQMKSRTKGVSPDLADAFCLTFAASDLQRSVTTVEPEVFFDS